MEASVAAILRAIWPLLPMPVTTTRPVMPASTLDRAGETVIKPGGQIHQRIGLRAQHTPRHRDVAIGGNVDLRLGTERPVGIDRMVQGRRTPKNLTGRNWRI